MRHPALIGLCLLGAATLTACGNSSDAEVDRAMKAVGVIDESNLNDIMLTVGDPDEAVSYFAKGVATDPTRVDLKRGLAKSLVRAGKPLEALPVWDEVTKAPEGTLEDKVEYADAFIRANKWPEAEAMLNTIPPTHETYQRYKLEAMVADSKRDWKKADSFYEIAAGLTQKPAPVYNNWGYSKLTRGDYAGAERLFIDALTYEPNMFTAKNNLVLARGAQRKYDLPVVQMTQTERAQLLYTMALTAIKQRDVTIGKGLLQEAVDTHPQHFEEASRALAALDANVVPG
jgi:tetratricopeptide (TPR) repeat protein